MAESDWIVACKEGPCVPCQVWFWKFGNRCDGAGNDFHHMKSGNLRRGHLFGIGACIWHHRGIPLDGCGPQFMREIYGPSLMDGGKRFAESYGTDDELLALQKRLLREE